MKKFKMKYIKEIIDSNDELIGKDAIPQHGSDLESRANGTTDQNVNIGNQPYRYDMMGRFGFTLLPFYEGKGDESHVEMVNDLTKLIDDNYLDFLHYYIKNPNKLKSDYRKRVQDKINTDVNNTEGTVKNIIKIIQKYFKNAFNNIDNITESSISEDKMVDDWKDIELTEIADDNELKDKKIQKIAGLINKLDDKDIKKIINLLEVK